MKFTRVHPINLEPGDTINVQAELRTLNDTDKHVTVVGIEWRLVTRETAEEPAPDHALKFEDVTDPTDLGNERGAR